VAFGIIPLFALANAGVTIDAKGLGESVLIAVAAGLAIGKPVGILSFSWIAARLGWIRLPDNLTWTIFAGGACMAGIGFTMALFVNALAFSQRIQLGVGGDGGSWENRHLVRDRSSASS
jgi:NhaA family Na+:H+ antiporter